MLAILLMIDGCYLLIVVANINQYQKKMVRELMYLRLKLTMLTIQYNNLTGAIYQDALSTEMLAVTNKYQSLIDTATTNINKLTFTSAVTEIKYTNTKNLYDRYGGLVDCQPS
jgi:hypothetical protein